MRITVPPLWNIKGFINLHPPIINVCSFVVFYFSLFCSVQNRDSLCCHFLSRLVRTSSNGQEAVWFFCSTVIRPPLSLPCKCDAKHLKVLSPMIKDSSLSVAILCLIQAPTEQCVQPREKAQLSPKRGSAFFIFQGPPTPELDVEFQSSF